MDNPIDFTPLVKKAEKAAKPQWHDYKKKLFMEAYWRCNGVNNEIARDLGITRVQVWRLRKKFNLL